MRLPVLYAQNIIVGVITSGRWQWYVTGHDFWVLDQGKLRGFDASEHAVSNLDSSEGRFAIEVVNQDTLAQFLRFIESFKASTEELRAQFLAEERDGKLGGDDWYKFIPSLLVDFDSRRLLSLYPEPYSFEDYVPAGWTGIYEDFLPLVPVSERYWVIEGVNYFEKR